MVSLTLQYVHNHKKAGWVQLHHLRKIQIWLDYIKAHQFSFMLHWLLFKMSSILLHAQFSVSQKKICFLSEKFITFPLMQSLESKISCNHTILCKVLKHLNAYSNVMVDKWAYGFFNSKWMYNKLKFSTPFTKHTVYILLDIIITYIQCMINALLCDFWPMPHLKTDRYNILISLWLKMKMADITAISFIIMCHNLFWTN
jgi:hypothetical protein